ncbi:hypothetical protein G9A89_000341 [Geosiphon pyriformis]|nr:hypothetical protein G9A89_000341 [Geosiphon pyriformis]
MNVPFVIWSLRFGTDGYNSDFLLPFCPPTVQWDHQPLPTLLAWIPPLPPLVVELVAWLTSYLGLLPYWAQGTTPPTVFLYKATAQPPGDSSVTLLPTIPPPGWIPNSPYPPVLWDPSQPYPPPSTWIPSTDTHLCLWLGISLFLVPFATPTWVLMVPSLPPWILMIQAILDQHPLYNQRIPTNHLSLWVVGDDGSSNCSWDLVPPTLPQNPLVGYAYCP